ncbi:hypothetical protein NP493_606g03031 [Ridgeia piscesae]|uniref:Fibrinogen C-terminal domain-containing protein n=1 Tax=Ridgeia piscesae TaxID=27915 RepID=A0AAD9KTR2_RIDPI|nr:hypothetical protein NP493_606g03031 [Ridgeia piscesae]
MFIFLGNDYLHEITSQARYTLRVDLTAFNGTKRFAVYSTFAVADESAKYRLSVSGYHGTAGDSMRYTNGMVFSTKDRDNDHWSTVHCAVAHTGAWWFRLCSEAFLNGVYQHGVKPVATKGIHWIHFSGYHISLQKSEMKIRPT